MSNILEALKVGAGVLAGKKEAEVKAAGGVLIAQQKIKKLAGKLGKSVGKITGSAVLSSAADQAEAQDQADTEKLLKDRAGFSLANVKAGLIVLALAVAGFFFLRRRATK